MATTTRTVRIDHATWTAAQRTAEQQGITVTDVVRDALRAFVREHSTYRLWPHHDPIEGEVGIDPWTVEQVGDKFRVFAYRARAEPGTYAKVMRPVVLSAAEVAALERKGGRDHA
jgi:hypothetical protein